jgi:hypothetical protein
MHALHLGCPENNQLFEQPPNLTALAPMITFGVNPNKATIDKSGAILVDKQYWDSLDGLARQALLYHEMAHQQRGGCAHSCDGKPGGCERCADNRFGASMVLAGHSIDDVKSASKALRIKSRKTTTADAIAGAMAVYREKAAQQGLVKTSERPTETRKSGTSQQQSPGFYQAPPGYAGTAGTPDPGKSTAPDANPETPADAGQPDATKKPTDGKGGTTTKPGFGSFRPSKPGTKCDCSGSCDCKNFEWLVGVVGVAVVISVLASEWLSE